jgi:hypothetical protein
MRSTRQQARLAGLLYLLMALTAPLGLIVVPGRVVVAGDPAATAARVRDLDWLLRLGIGSELVHQVLAVFLVLALYRLFRPVDEGLARQLVILGAAVSVPIVFVNVLNEVAALVLVSDAGFLAAFDTGQREALAYLALHLHSQGIVVASVFWGLWLFPFGLLVVRCGFVPRLLGWLLMAAGAGYLATAVATLVVPRWEPIARMVAMPLAVAELPIIVWLAIWGARPRHAAAGSGPAPG